uniref:Uncharacterized protein n=1 Tax=viral metagenome TaxID=1070528 RepID=A0A2V0RCJ9_9ZZZZ
MPIHLTRINSPLRPYAADAMTTVSKHLVFDGIGMALSFARYPASQLKVYHLPHDVLRSVYSRNPIRDTEETNRLMASAQDRRNAPAATAFTTIEVDDRGNTRVEPASTVDVFSTTLRGSALAAKITDISSFAYAIAKEADSADFTNNLADGPIENTLLWDYLGMCGLSDVTVDGGGQDISVQVAHQLQSIDPDPFGDEEIGGILDFALADFCAVFQVRFPAIVEALTRGALTERLAGLGYTRTRRALNQMVAMHRASIMSTVMLAQLTCLDNDITSDRLARRLPTNQFINLGAYKSFFESVPKLEQHVIRPLMGTYPSEEISYEQVHRVYHQVSRLMNFVPDVMQREFPRLMSIAIPKISMPPQPTMVVTDTITVLPLKDLSTASDTLAQQLYYGWITDTYEVNNAKFVDGVKPTFTYRYGFNATEPKVSEFLGPVTGFSRYVLASDFGEYQPFNSVTASMSSDGTRVLSVPGFSKKDYRITLTVHRATELWQDLTLQTANQEIVTTVNDLYSEMQYMIDDRETDTLPTGVFLDALLPSSGTPWGWADVPQGSLDGRPEIVENEVRPTDSVVS